MRKWLTPSAIVIGESPDTVTPSSHRRRHQAHVHRVTERSRPWLANFVPWPGSNAIRQVGRRPGFHLRPPRGARFQTPSAVANARRSPSRPRPPEALVGHARGAGADSDRLADESALSVARSEPQTRSQRFTMISHAADGSSHRGLDATFVKELPRATPRRAGTGRHVVDLQSMPFVTTERQGADASWPANARFAVASRRSTSTKGPEFV